MKKKKSLPVVEPKRIRISQSLLQDFETCQYRFGKIHHENLAKRYPTRPLAVGTLVHAGLEGFLLAQFKEPKISKSKARAVVLDAVANKQREFMNQDYIKDHIDNEWKEEANKNCSDSVEITLRCVAWLGFFSDDCDWETVSHHGKPLVEFEMLSTMKIKVGRKVIEFDLGGRLDWVARKKSTGRTYLIDFKTRDQMQKPEYDHKQTQSPLYLHLLSEVGIEVHGTATLQIRRALPQKPRQNQTKPKGDTIYPMSRESIVTDWETYESALKEAGLDPAAYQDVKAKLKPFFSLSPEMRSRIEVENVMKDVMRGAVDVLTTSPDQYYRSRYPMNCQGCDFEELCTADLLGHDVDFLKQTAYYDKTKPQFIDVDFDDDDAESFAWGEDAAEQARSFSR